MKTPLEKEEQGTLREPCRLKNMKQELTDQKNMKLLGYSQGIRMTEFGQHSGRKEKKKLDKMKRY